LKEAFARIDEFERSSGRRKNEMLLGGIVEQQVANAPEALLGFAAEVGLLKPIPDFANRIEIKFKGGTKFYSGVPIDALKDVKISLRPAQTPSSDLVPDSIFKGTPTEQLIGGASSAQPISRDLLKYRDIEYVENVMARVSQRSLKRALREGLSGRAAGARAEAIFENYGYDMQLRLMAADSPYRITLQPAGESSTGMRAIARTQSSFRLWLLYSVSRKRQLCTDPIRRGLYHHSQRSVHYPVRVLQGVSRSNNLWHRSDEYFEVEYVTHSAVLIGGDTVSPWRVPGRRSGGTPRSANYFNC
jgi:hypothetical protein